MLHLIKCLVSLEEDIKPQTDREMVQKVAKEKGLRRYLGLGLPSSRTLRKHLLLWLPNFPGIFSQLPEHTIADFSVGKCVLT